MTQEKTCTTCASEQQTKIINPKGARYTPLDSSDQAALRTYCKQVFSSSWTGLDPGNFEDGTMSVEVYNLVNAFMTNWNNCHALVSALLSVWRSFSPVTSPGSMSSNLPDLLSKLDGLLAEEVAGGALDAAAYRACKLSAWNGIKDALYDALMAL